MTSVLDKYDKIHLLMHEYYWSEEGHSFDVLLLREAQRKNVELVGTTQEVLVEKPAKRGPLLQTRTRTNKVVLVEGPPGWIGSYRTVRLSGTTGATFTGVEVQNAGKELAVVG